MPKIILYLLLAIFISGPMANAEVLSGHDFNQRLVILNKELTELQTKQLPVIAQLTCADINEDINAINSVPTHPCGSYFISSHYFMRNLSDTGWDILDYQKNIDYKHQNLLGDIYDKKYPGSWLVLAYRLDLDLVPDSGRIEIFNFKTPEIFENKSAWLFRFDMDRQLTFIYHVDQATGYIIQHDTILTLSPQRITRTNYNIQTKAKLPDSFFEDKLNPIFFNPLKNSIATVNEGSYRIMPFVWLIVFAWIFTRLVTRGYICERHVKVTIFIAGLLAPILMGVLFYMVTAGWYLLLGLMISSDLTYGINKSLEAILPLYSHLIANFMVTFLTNFVHDTISLLPFYFIFRIWVKKQKYK